MVGPVPPTADPAVAARITVPLPRRPLRAADLADPSDRLRGWYENELGWATVPGEPVRLSTGLRFDVLDVPVEAGHAALRRLAPGSPVAAWGDRVRLLVAAGSAEELPGILRWLEWGALPLDLTAIGAGGAVEAPLPPGRKDPGSESPGSQDPGSESAGSQGPGSESPGSQDPGSQGPGSESFGSQGLGSMQGAAVWVRPPVAGCEVEASLPTVSALGGGGGAPDLVRLVDTLATHCHRVRLRRRCAQPLACS
jgi:hypothetical protein